MVKFYCMILSIVMGLCAITSSYAEPLEKPKGKIILRVSGQISNTNSGSMAEFDLAGLEALGLSSFKTSTPWHNNEITFEGVLLEKLMDVVGAKGKSVKAIAWNDYTVTIPIDDFKRFGTLLALKRDGEYMTVRDKGPLFIVYPYNQDTQLQNQAYYTRSVWQLKKLIVE